MHPDVALSTARLDLHCFTPDDVDLLIALDDDPGVKRYIDGGLPADRADIADMLDYWLALDERFGATHHGYGFRAAVDRASGAFAGWFHLRPQREAPVRRARARVSPASPVLGSRAGHRRVGGVGRSRLRARREPGAGRDDGA